MASTPLTLAALATSAVPGLRVSAYRPVAGGGIDDYASAVLATEDRELIVRVPRNPSAEVRQSAEMLGLSALADGARAALPFQVPEVLGLTRAGDTRAVVSTFVPGSHIEPANLESDALLLQPIADALAAIHRLPVAVIQQAGLPVRSADDARAVAARLIERAADTRLLPDLVRSRWQEALDSPRLWDFAPTVVHGALDADQLLIEDDRITGVLGWHELSVGDPSIDLAWLLGIGPEVFDAVWARYIASRGTTGSAEMRARARFHHELGVARWLLHGVDSHDDSIVDDAIGMLDRLVDRVSRAGSPVAPERTTTTPDEVDQLLDSVPEVATDPRSETAEYEALDEDRAFSVDDDFTDEDDRAASHTDSQHHAPDSEDSVTASPAGEIDEQAPEGDSASGERTV